MGGVISGVGGMIDNTLGTSIFGENANDKAASAQGRATGQANAALAPYSEVGAQGLLGLSDSNIFGTGGFQTDPGYQFRLEQGNNAINSSMAARGLGNSGAALKALTRYGQDFASNEYNNAYNREFNRLGTLANIGQNAATGISNNYLGLGNAQAAAAIGKANQTGNFVGGLMGAGGNAGGFGNLFSDERLKTDFKEVQKSKLETMRKQLKAWAFKYKDEMHGRGVWTGVMAQDLEKTALGKELVFENSKGEKQIHIGKAVSMWLATLAEA